MGDPAGVGPEVILKAMRSARTHSAARCLVTGDAAWLAHIGRQLQLGVEVRAVQSVAEAQFAEGVVDVLDLRNAPLDQIQLGVVNPQGGKAAVEAVQVAANLALQGLVDAIATAPLNKEAMHLAGYRYPGHTELLAEMTGTEDYSMLLVTPNLRVFFVTVHVSLRKALDLITTDRVRRIIGVAQRTLHRLGFSHPRIAVAGLNPHAGEGGLFGDEEIRAISPAVSNAQVDGIDATGPWPPDTVFARAMAGHYDAVVAMYHDQGHIPIKLLGFQDGVNVTAGLPIIRTSVDHGTAFDIAGKGIADENSMIEAILLASRLAGASMTKETA
ncbi:MAG: 4-hydroxythreonine-4-phosphate dehydrogenase PdxA [Bacillota bacterium]